METIQYPCGRDVIERVLPHRDPFVWVSRVLECEPGASITAELDVDPALPLFAGHFPGTSGAAGRHHHGGARANGIVLRARRPR